MADLSGLSRALGQAVQTGFQIKREKERQARRQEDIDLSNSIVQEAIDMGDNMMSKDVTPFIRERNIRKHISEREQEYGLQTGSALSAYKQFFSLGAMGGGRGGGSEFKTVQKDTGTILINKGTGESSFVPYDKGTQAALEREDEINANTGILTEVMKDYGVVLQPGAAAELSKDMTQIKKYPELYNAFKHWEEDQSLERKWDRLKQKGEIQMEEAVNTYEKDNPLERVDTLLESLIQQSYSKTDKTLAMDEALLLKKINEVKAHHPRAFNKYSGNYADDALKILRMGHRAGVKKGRLGELRVDEQTYDTLSNIKKAMIRNNAYSGKGGDDLIKMELIADGLKDLNPMVVEGMMGALGIQRGDVFWDKVVHTYKGAGKERMASDISKAQSSIQDAADQWDKSYNGAADTPKEDSPKPKDFDWDNDPLTNDMSTIIKNFTNRGHVPSLTYMESAAKLTEIGRNPKLKEQVNNWIDTYIEDQLHAPDQNAEKLKIILRKIKTEINRN